MWWRPPPTSPCVVLARAWSFSRKSLRKKSTLRYVYILLSVYVCACACVCVWFYGEMSISSFFILIAGMVNSSLCFKNVLISNYLLHCHLFLNLETRAMYASSWSLCSSGFSYATGGATRTSDCGDCDAAQGSADTRVLCLCKADSSQCAGAGPRPHGQGSQARHRSVLLCIYFLWRWCWGKILLAFSWIHLAPPSPSYICAVLCFFMN